MLYSNFYSAYIDAYALKVVCLLSDFDLDQYQSINLASQDTNNEGKRMAAGVDYLSPTLEKSFLNKPEGLGMCVCSCFLKQLSNLFYGKCIIEDSSCEDSNQIKLTTFRRREELIMERHDVEGGNSGEDEHDGNEEDKKSITEEAVSIIKVGPPVAAKPTQSVTEEAVTTVKVGPPVTAKPPPLITEEALAAVKLGPPVAAKPTPSPRNAK